MKAHRYVALLRAINVGGHGVVTMAALRDALAPLALTDLATVAQSGNLVFGSTDTDTAAIARAIERRVDTALGLTTSAFVVTPARLARVAAENPLATRAATHHVHVVFLSRAPAADRATALDALSRDHYTFALRGSVLYMAYARDFVGRRPSLDLTRSLGVDTTARTIGMIDQLIAKASEESRAPSPRAKKRRPRAK
jgi:uncharacterized protein (DUF1697 family)